MLRQSWLLFLAISCLVLGGGSNAAHAYQTVQVGSSGATVFADPQSDSATTGTLRAGQSVNISDKPRGGYYRATAAGGITGWIQEDALVLPVHRTHQASHVTASPGQSSERSGGATPPKFYVGGLIGLGVAGGGTSTAFGVNGGYKLTREWGLGAYFQYLGISGGSTATSGTTASGTGASSTASGSLMMFAGEVNYFLPQVEGFFLGAKVGFGMASATATGSVTALGSTTPVTSVSSSTFAFGAAAAAGYDYPVIPILSIGGEANCFFVSGGIASTLINVLASVKYSF